MTVEPMAWYRDEDGVRMYYDKQYFDDAKPLYSAQGEEQVNEKTIKGECSVELIRENEDGSADYAFNFPPEALDALTRLGILTAIQAGIEDAKRLNPEEPVNTSEERVAEEAYKRAMRDAVGLLKTQHELVKERHNYYRHAANIIHLEFLEEDDDRQDKR